LETLVRASRIIFTFLPVLFLFMLALLEFGRRMGMRKDVQVTEHERAGLMSVGAAVYGSIGLMVAFTFSGAASRFEARRIFTVQEPNAIGTAYLRLDLFGRRATGAAG
jgi:hypothetical protein